MRRCLVISLMLACACGAQAQRHRGPTDTALLGLMATALPTFTIPTNGLANEYLFDGNAYDTAGTVDGNVIGTIPFTNNYAEGGAAGSTIEVGDNTQFLIQNSAIFTISFWARLDDPTNSIADYVFDNCAFATAARGIGMRFYAGGLRFEAVRAVSGSPAFSLNVASVVSDSDWHLYQAYGNGTNVWLDVDMSCVATSVVNGTTTGVANGGLHMLSKNSTAQFRGDIDNFRYYIVNLEYEDRYQMFLEGPD